MSENHRGRVVDVVRLGVENSHTSAGVLGGGNVRWATRSIYE